MLFKNNANNKLLDINLMSWCKYNLKLIETKQLCKLNSNLILKLLLKIVTYDSKSLEYP